MVKYEEFKKLHKYLQSLCFSLFISYFDMEMFQFIRARKAVVSNASMWDTLKLLPPGALPDSYVKGVNTTPQCESFMHLHLGFDAEV